MTQDDVKDPAGTPEPEDTPGQSAPESPPAAEPEAPSPEPGGSTPAAPEPPAATPLPEATLPTPPPEPSPPVPEPPVAAAAPTEAPAPSPPAAPTEPSPEASEPTPEPVDEISQWVRIGQVGSGRRLGPPDPALREAIRDFASQRPLPGIGTLVDLARAHADSDRGPSLGVDAFTEIRSQLGRLVQDLEAVAVHVGPVLFLKTSAKNQPGTALRWLHADERAVLQEHPELLDHPGRLVATLRKRTTGEE